ncbi:hypothetical protein QVD17_05917 [Tagetes erecta]|uniref:X8 domain-containing protein n=1 Tax=Tagetes erecta TaxID=13708 RepID=A0AAD8LEP9_TARER|nr:hypothetical protein QVD17_05917 [Tagetes erecta]
MSYQLLGFLYAFVISSYHAYASPSYARLPGVLTLKLTSSQRYHVVNHLEGDLPLSPVLPEAYCANPPGGSPPSTTTLPPPAPLSDSNPFGSYNPSPPAYSSSYPTPPASSSSYPSGGSPPSTTTLPPPSTVSGSNPYGSYNPSPPASSSSYPTPPASSSSYPTYPTPPISYGTPYTPPVSTNPGSPATYQPGTGLSPPYSYEPSPGLSPPYSSDPSPPTFSFPSPTGFIPAPPLFEPPIVYPPPNGPAPPHIEPESALWCVAKPSVPDPIIQEAMNYACGSGADCEALQPNGDCFQPDTLFAHASYAFNSYWQRTKVGGGTCEFGGAAMLVTVDPSYDGCHFLYF